MRIGRGIRTKVLRKLTHTLKFASVRTNRPRKEALGSLKGLVSKAVRLTDS